MRSGLQILFITTSTCPAEHVEELKTIFAFFNTQVTNLHHN